MSFINHFSTLMLVVRMSLLQNIVSSFVILMVASSTSSEVREKPLSEYIDRFTLLTGDALLEYANGSNVVFSPINLYHAFSILHLGSDQKTREELSSIFGFPENPENDTDYHVKFNQTLHSLQALNDITVAEAVGVFARNDLKFKPPFVERVKSMYDVNMQNVDFSNASTTQYLNSWISERTKDHIKDYFKQTISSDTQLQLISASYFGANWKYTFGKTNTQKEDFHTGYSLLKVDMMSELIRLDYGDDPKYPFRILGLAYKNEDLRLYIQLPREDPKSTSFTNNFTAIYLTSLQAVDSLKPNLVHIKLPRFSLNSKINLDKVLKKFGSTQISESPQLSGIFEGQVQKLDVNHGVHIDVDENGAEASSGPLISSGVGIPEIPVEFFVNKPFTFFIYSKSLKTILFAGAISRIE